jgi:hypothetical protein
VRELRPGLWHWEVPHPGWKDGEPWDPVVSSYAFDDGERLLLFDPMSPPSEIDALAADRETAVVLTCPWHERAEGKGDARPYTAGDRLPVGIEAFPGQKPNDMVLWIESHAAVIAGDTLVDFDHGLHINPGWLSPGVTREQVVEGLRPLLELPVEHVLATHGGPFDRAALERALA